MAGLGPLGGRRRRCGSGWSRGWGGQRRCRRWRWRGCSGGGGIGGRGRCCGRAVRAWHRDSASASASFSLHTGAGWGCRGRESRSGMSTLEPRSWIWKWNRSIEGPLRGAQLTPSQHAADATRHAPGLAAAHCSPRMPSTPKHHELGPKRYQNGNDSQRLTPNEAGHLSGH